MRASLIIDVVVEDDLSGGEVSVGATVDNVPIEVFIVAAEHLMTFCAMQSALGFDKALESLVEGARSNKIKAAKGTEVGNA